MKVPATGSNAIALGTQALKLPLSVAKDAADAVSAVTNGIEKLVVSKHKAASQKGKTHKPKHKAQTKTHAPKSAHKGKREVHKPKPSSSNANHSKGQVKPSKYVLYLSIILLLPLTLATADFDLFSPPEHILTQKTLGRALNDSEIAAMAEAEKRNDLRNAFLLTLADSETFSHHISHEPVPSMDYIVGNLPRHKRKVVDAISKMRGKIYSTDSFNTAYEKSYAKRVGEAERLHASIFAERHPHAFMHRIGSTKFLSLPVAEELGRKLKEEVKRNPNVDSNLNYANWAKSMRQYHPGTQSPVTQEHVDSIIEYAEDIVNVSKRANTVTQATPTKPKPTHSKPPAAVPSHLQKKSAERKPVAINKSSRAADVDFNSCTIIKNDYITSAIQDYVHMANIGIDGGFAIFLGKYSATGSFDQIAKDYYYAIGDSMLRPRSSATTYHFGSTPAGDPGHYECVYNNAKIRVWIGLVVRQLFCNPLYFFTIALTPGVDWLACLSDDGSELTTKDSDKVICFSEGPDFYKSGSSVEANWAMGSDRTFHAGCATGTASWSQSDFTEVKIINNIYVGCLGNDPATGGQTSGPKTDSDGNTIWPEFGHGFHVIGGIAGIVIASVFINSHFGRLPTAAFMILAGYTLSVYAECSADGLVYEMAKVDGTSGTTQAWQYQGMIRAGTCLHAGSDTYFIRSVKRQLDFPLKGYGPMEITFLPSFQDYGCPLGKGSDICNRDQKSDTYILHACVSEEWGVEAVELPCTRGTIWFCAEMQAQALDVKRTVSIWSNPQQNNPLSYEVCSGQTLDCSWVTTGQHITIGDSTVDVGITSTIDAMPITTILNFNEQWYATGANLDYSSVCWYTNDKKPWSFTQNNCVKFTATHSQANRVWDWQVQTNNIGQWLTGTVPIAVPMQDITGDTAKLDNKGQMLYVTTELQNTYTSATFNVPINADRDLCGSATATVAKIDPGKSEYYKYSVVLLTFTADPGDCHVQLSTSRCNILGPKYISVTQGKQAQIGILCGWSKDITLVIQSKNQKTEVNLSGLVVDYHWALSQTWTTYVTATMMSFPTVTSAINGVQGYFERTFGSILSVKSFIADFVVKWLFPIAFIAAGGFGLAYGIPPVLCIASLLVGGGMIFQTLYGVVAIPVDTIMYVSHEKSDIGEQTWSLIFGPLGIVIFGMYILTKTMRLLYWIASLMELTTPRTHTRRASNATVVSVAILCLLPCISSLDIIKVNETIHIEGSEVTRHAVYSTGDWLFFLVAIPTCILIGAAAGGAYMHVRNTNATRRRQDIASIYARFQANSLPVAALALMVLQTVSSENYEARTIMQPVENEFGIQPKISWPWHEAVANASLRVTATVVGYLSAIVLMIAISNRPPWIILVIASGAAAEVTDILIIGTGGLRALEAFLRYMGGFFAMEPTTIQEVGFLVYAIMFVVFLMEVTDVISMLKRFIFTYVVMRFFSKPRKVLRKLFYQWRNGTYGYNGRWNHPFVDALVWAWPKVQKEDYRGNTMAYPLRDPKASPYNNGRRYCSNGPKPTWDASAIFNKVATMCKSGGLTCFANSGRTLSLLDTYTLQGHYTGDKVYGDEQYPQRDSDMIIRNITVSRKNKGVRANEFQLTYISEHKPIYEKSVTNYWTECEPPKKTGKLEREFLLVPHHCIDFIKYPVNMCTRMDDGYIIGKPKELMRSSLLKRLMTPVQCYEVSRPLFWHMPDGRRTCLAAKNTDSGVRLYECVPKYWPGMGWDSIIAPNADEVTHVRGTSGLMFHFENNSWWHRGCNMPKGDSFPLAFERDQDEHQFWRTVQRQGRNNAIAQVIHCQANEFVCSEAKAVCDKARVMESGAPNHVMGGYTSLTYVEMMEERFANAYKKNPEWIMEAAKKTNSNYGCNINFTTVQGHNVIRQLYDIDAPSDPIPECIERITLRKMSRRQRQKRRRLAHERSLGTQYATADMEFVEPEPLSEVVSSMLLKYVRDCPSCNDRLCKRKDHDKSYTISPKKVYRRRLLKDFARNRVFFTIGPVTKQEAARPTAADIHKAMRRAIDICAKHGHVHAMGRFQRHFWDFIDQEVPMEIAFTSNDTVAYDPQWMDLETGCHSISNGYGRHLFFITKLDNILLVPAHCLKPGTITEDPNIILLNDLYVISVEPNLDIESLLNNVFPIPHSGVYYPLVPHNAETIPWWNINGKTDTGICKISIREGVLRWSPPDHHATCAPPGGSSGLCFKNSSGHLLINTHNERGAIFANTVEDTLMDYIACCTETHGMSPKQAHAKIFHHAASGHHPLLPFAVLYRMLEMWESDDEYSLAMIDLAIAIKIRHGNDVNMKHLWPYPKKAKGRETTELLPRGCYYYKNVGGEYDKQDLMRKYLSMLYNGNPSQKVRVPNGFFDQCRILRSTYSYLKSQRYIVAEASPMEEQFADTLIKTINDFEARGVPMGMEERVPWTPQTKPQDAKAVMAMVEDDAIATQPHILAMTHNRQVYGFSVMKQGEYVTCDHVLNKCDIEMRTTVTCNDGERRGIALPIENTLSDSDADISGTATHIITPPKSGDIGVVYNPVTNAKFYLYCHLAGTEYDYSKKTASVWSFVKVFRDINGRVYEVFIGAPGNFPGYSGLPIVNIDSFAVVGIYGTLTKALDDRDGGILTRVVVADVGNEDIGARFKEGAELVTKEPWNRNTPIPMVQADTGTGKSTAFVHTLIKTILSKGAEKLSVVVLQPTRPATKNTYANYVRMFTPEEEPNVYVQYRVGDSGALDDAGNNGVKQSSPIKILFQTYGLANANTNPLKEADLVVFDEIHERSVDVVETEYRVFCLAPLLKPTVYAVAVTATPIDNCKYHKVMPRIAASRHEISHASLFESHDDKPLPSDMIEIDFGPSTRQAAASNANVHRVAIDKRIFTQPSDTPTRLLVFLPTANDCTLAKKKVNDTHPEIQVYIVHAKENIDMVMINESSGSFIIFATNYVATSVTLPQLTDVVVLGFENRVDLADHNLKESIWQRTERIFAIRRQQFYQQRGRVGRQLSGRYWTIPSYQNGPVDDMPECELDTAFQVLLRTIKTQSIEKLLADPTGDVTKQNDDIAYRTKEWCPTIHSAAMELRELDHKMIEDKVKKGIFTVPDPMALILAKAVPKEFVDNLDKNIGLNKFPKSQFSEAAKLSMNIRKGFGWSITDEGLVGDTLAYDNQFISSPTWRVTNTLQGLLPSGLMTAGFMLAVLWAAIGCHEEMKPCVSSRQWIVSFQSYAHHCLGANDAKYSEASTAEKLAQLARQHVCETIKKIIAVVEKSTPSDGILAKLRRALSYQHNSSPVASSFFDDVWAKLVTIMGWIKTAAAGIDYDGVTKWLKNHGDMFAASGLGIFTAFIFDRACDIFSTPIATVSLAMLYAAANIFLINPVTAVGVNVCFCASAIIAYFCTKKVNGSKIKGVSMILGGGSGIVLSVLYKAAVAHHVNIEHAPLAISKFFISPSDSTGNLILFIKACYTVWYYIIRAILDPKGGFKIHILAALGSIPEILATCSTMSVSKFISCIILGGLFAAVAVTARANKERKLGKVMCDVKATTGVAADSAIEWLELGITNADTLIQIIMGVLCCAVAPHTIFSVFLTIIAGYIERASNVNTNRTMLDDAFIGAGTPIIASMCSFLVRLAMAWHDAPNPNHNSINIKHRVEGVEATTEFSSVFNACRAAVNVVRKKVGVPPTSQPMTMGEKMWYATENAKNIVGALANGFWEAVKFVVMWIWNKIFPTTKKTPTPTFEQYSEEEVEETARALGVGSSSNELRATDNTYEEIGAQESVRERIKRRLKEEAERPRTSHTATEATINTTVRWASSTMNRFFNNAETENWMTRMSHRIAREVRQPNTVNKMSTTTRENLAKWSRLSKCPDTKPSLHLAGVETIRNTSDLALIKRKPFVKQLGYVLFGKASGALDDETTIIPIFNVKGVPHTQRLASEIPSDFDHRYSAPRHEPAIFGFCQTGGHDVVMRASYFHDNTVNFPFAGTKISDHDFTNAQKLLYSADIQRNWKDGPHGSLRGVMSHVMPNPVGTIVGKGYYRAFLIQEIVDVFKKFSIMLDLSAGNGGYVQAAMEMNKDCHKTIFYNTLNKERHAMPKVALLKDSGLCKAYHLASQTSGNIMENYVLDTIQNQIKETDRPDLMVWDAGESNASADEETAWMTNKWPSLTRARNLLLRRGGCMLIKVMGWQDRTINGIHKLFLPFKRVVSFCVSSNSLASRQWYMYGEGFDPCTTLKLADYLCHVQCEGMRRINKAIAVYRAEIDHAKYNRHYIFPTYRKHWITPELEVTGFQAPRAFEDTPLFKAMDGTMFDPQFKIRREQLISHLRAKIGWQIIPGLPTNFQNCRSIGFAKGVGMRNKAINQATDKLIAEMMNMEYGIDGRTASIGHTQTGPEATARSYAKRLDKNPHGPPPDIKAVIQETIPHMFTPRGKELKHTFSISTFEECLKWINPKGSGGKLDKHRNMGDACKDPAFKAEVLREMENLRLGRITHAYTVTANNKTETKARKNIDSQGRLQFTNIRRDPDEGRQMDARQIQFYTLVGRMLDLMLFGAIIEADAEGESKLLLGNITGLPAHLTGTILKAQADTFVIPQYREIIDDDKPTRTKRYYTAAGREFFGKRLPDKLTLAILCGDFSSFDGTVSPDEHIDIIRVIMNHFLKPQHHQCCNNRFRHVVFKFVLLETGEVIEVEGQVCSGCGLTSFGNKSINDVLHAAAGSLALGISPEEYLTILGWIEMEIRGKKKKFYITRITTNADGDDNIHLGDKRDMAIYNDFLGFMESCGKKVRSGNESGYKSMHRFEDLDFCSHQYRRIVVGPYVRTMRRGAILGLGEIAKQRAKFTSKDRVYYAQTRPLSIILGKLTLTMQRLCTQYDPNDRGLAMATTKGKTMSYALQYAHILRVRKDCLGLLSILPKGVAPQFESWNYERLFGCELGHEVSVTTLEGALKHIYGVDSFDEIQTIDWREERAMVDALAYNAKLFGKYCCKTVREGAIMMQPVFYKYGQQNPDVWNLDTRLKSLMIDATFNQNVPWGPFFFNVTEGKYDTRRAKKAIEKAGGELDFNYWHRFDEPEDEIEAQQDEAENDFSEEYTMRTVDYSWDRVSDKSPEFAAYMASFETIREPSSSYALVIPPGVGKTIVAQRLSMIDLDDLWEKSGYRGTGLRIKGQPDLGLDITDGPKFWNHFKTWASDAPIVRRALSKKAGFLVQHPGLARYLGLGHRIAGFIRTDESNMRNVWKKRGEEHYKVLASNIHYYLGTPSTPWVIAEKANKDGNHNTSVILRALASHQKAVLGDFYKSDIIRSYPNDTYLE